MDGLGKKILDALKLYKNEFNRKVLKTCEEVEANTSDEYLVAAPVVGELINDLNGCKIITEGSGANTKYYIQNGADAASKKLLGSAYKINCTLSFYATATPASGGSGGTTITPSSKSLNGYIVVYNNKFKVYNLSGSGAKNGSGGNAYIIAYGSITVTSVEIVDPRNYFG